MARAINGRGAAFDVRPAGEPAYGGSIIGPITGLVGFLMDMVRGSCAGLLTLLGVLHMTQGAQAAPAAPQGLETIAAIAQQFSMNGFAGPAELIGGLVLFLTARRGIARTLGVLAFIALVAAYAQGITLADIASLAWAQLGVAATALADAAAAQIAARAP